MRSPRAAEPAEASRRQPLVGRDQRVPPPRSRNSHGSSSTMSSDSARWAASAAARPPARPAQPRALSRRGRHRSRGPPPVAQFDQPGAGAVEQVRALVPDRRPPVARWARRWRWPVSRTRARICSAAPARGWRNSATRRRSSRRTPRSPGPRSKLGGPSRQPSLQGEAAQRAESLELVQLLPWLLRLRGAALCDLGQPTAAFEILQQARQLAGTHSQSRARVCPLRSSAECAVGLGSAGEAAEYARVAETALEQLGFVGSPRYPRRPSGPHELRILDEQHGQRERS